MATKAFKTIPAEVEAGKNADGEVVVSLDGETAAMPQGLFLKLFAAVPDRDVDGVSEWDCNCPSHGIIKVPKSVIFRAYDEGLGLAQANLIMPTSAPKNLEALFGVAAQMYSAGEIDRNPFLSQ